MTKLIKKIIRNTTFRIRYPNVFHFNFGDNVTFFSQAGQDIIIANILFENHFSGNKVFLDIGCNHPKIGSNSFFFDKHLGFKTIAVDPISKYCRLWKKQRSDAEYINKALGKESGKGFIYIPKKDDMSFTCRKQKSFPNYKKKKIEYDTVSNICAKRNIKEVAVCSIDVEGNELNVLKGINFEKVSFGVFAVENNSELLGGNTGIRKYLSEKGFTFFARVGNLDDIFVSRNLIKR